jgi:hypothetical protein
MDQPNWIMWAFTIVESEFHSFQAGQQGENQRQQKFQQVSAEMKKRG